MLLLDATNTLEYLHATGRLPADVSARVEALAWGVSNVVLRVMPNGRDDFVLKQSRAQLRTADPWFSRLDRIWREMGVMRVLAERLPAGVVPHVLFEDREQYLFGMEAAPADHTVWKQLLLQGQPSAQIAAKLGEYLAEIHRTTAFDDELAEAWGDTEVFVQLRVDPFYRRVAAAHPEVQPAIFAMIDEMFATRICLVHADFSPKNVLVHRGGITLVDFETGHYGDPAFDLGFFLSHLLLKTVLHAGRFDEYAALTESFWTRYHAGLEPLAGRRQFAPRELERRTLAHLAGCMWARIDGTSKVDYLPDPAAQEAVRRFCRSLLLDPPATWSTVLDRLRQETTVIAKGKNG